MSVLKSFLVFFFKWSGRHVCARPSAWFKQLHFGIVESVQLHSLKRSMQHSGQTLWGGLSCHCSIHFGFFFLYTTEGWAVKPGCMSPSNIFFLSIVHLDFVSRHLFQSTAKQQWKTLLSNTSPIINGLCLLVNEIGVLLALCCFPVDRDGVTELSSHLCGNSG